MSFSTQLLFPRGIWIWNITWENYWYEPYLYGLIITVQVPDEARVPLRYIFRNTIEQLVMISTASISFNGSFTFVSCDNMKGFGWLLMLFFYVDAIFKMSPGVTPSITITGFGTYSTGCPSTEIPSNSLGNFAKLTNNSWFCLHLFLLTFCWNLPSKGFIIC